ncbi:hypothetical protein EI427_17870 [Flammeovirga pectinis]|uniref:Uncharacterized protein n=1 Tax=Flammeovirga pectinis TaxID=2494373 RepID=A0A3S9P741_9BACT|nr:hypothetical protein [Flammeovirga pectinis]AZQ64026.1 hypothetical protein EI427_17870 [Flammeovirga pectinis]
MKLVFIFSIDEGKQTELYALLSKVGVSTFSESSVKGIYTDVNPASLFFSNKSITATSKMDIVAASDEQATEIILAINTLNTTKGKFPIHAYTVDIENMTKA